ncbi:hypothetical protein BC826DRAFT_464733 [Russula brevipes]|nr:hypothetical protein BC826DRAFT_464733 [Russula brevipes]
MPAMPSDYFRVDQTTIDDLPDDTLLEIFGLYLHDKSPDDWHTLVHVCQRWRNVVFASPRHLDLLLRCTGDRSVRAMLDIWPTLPIEIDYSHWRASEMGPKNVIAALAHPDRLRHIVIIDFPEWEPLAAAMQVPFPELTVLALGVSSDVTSVSVIPGGSAPRLRTLDLMRIPLSAVRDLILSAGDLVDLKLVRSRYVSPESMVACLSHLKRLESLWLGIEPPQFRPDQPSLPPQERAVLPALVDFSFTGMREYLEDFVARVDAPVLSQVYTSFAADFVFDIPHFTQFIGRARGLKPSKAPRVLFASRSILLEFSPGSTLRINRYRTDWCISSIVLICGQLSPFFSLVERLDLVAGDDLEVGRPIESALFLELFRPFTAIEGLYVSKSLVPLIAPALLELIGERATEVLPNLRDLFLGGPVQETIQPFVDARQLSGRPIAIHRWEEK